MNIKDFRPAKEFAMRNGAKMLAYGPPGVGKTPIIDTAPRPCLLVCEPGMMSMRHSNVPSVQGETPKQIDDFFEWLFGSAESKQFDTVAIDSGSQMSENLLAMYLSGKSKSGNKVDGKAAYGDMSRHSMKHLGGLFFMPEKHVYIICKQQIDDVDGVKIAKPWFPGQDLNIKVPHMYDIVTQVGTFNVPGVGTTKAFRTGQSFDAVARDRSGSLAEYEPCNLTALFNKVMTS
jgi:hypothetical protein